LTFIRDFAILERSLISINKEIRLPACRFLVCFFAIYRGFGPLDNQCWGNMRMQRPFSLPEAPASAPLDFLGLSRALSSRFFCRWFAMQVINSWIKD